MNADEATFWDFSVVPSKWNTTKSFCNSFSSSNGWSLFCTVVLDAVCWFTLKCSSICGSRFRFLIWDSGTEQHSEMLLVCWISSEMLFSLDFIILGFNNLFQAFNMISVKVGCDILRIDICPWFFSWSSNISSNPSRSWGRQFLASINLLDSNFLIYAVTSNRWILLNLYPDVTWNSLE